MKKFLISTTLAATLCATLVSTASAEDSGVFVGANLGFGAARPDVAGYSSGSYTGFRIGILGGYKEIISSTIGLRGYATLELPVTKYTDGGSRPKVSSTNFYINGDVLYNFVQATDMEYGAFLGLGVGYIWHSVTNAGNAGGEPSGFDLAVNLGLRAVTYKSHSVELYSRFGLLEQEATAGGVTVKASQPWSIGARYVFSF